MTQGHSQRAYTLKNVEAGTEKYSKTGNESCDNHGLTRHRRRRDLLKRGVRRGRGRCKKIKRKKGVTNSKLDVRTKINNKWQQLKYWNVICYGHHE